MADQLRGDAPFTYAMEYYLDTVYRAACHHAPTVQEFVGVQDRFGQVGPQDFLMDEYGLRAANIVAAVKKAIARK